MCHLRRGAVSDRLISVLSCLHYSVLFIIKSTNIRCSNSTLTVIIVG